MIIRQGFFGSLPDFDVQASQDMITPIRAASPQKPAPTLFQKIPRNVCEVRIYVVYWEKVLDRRGGNYDE